MFQVIALHYENNDFTKRVETVIFETVDLASAHRNVRNNELAEIEHEQEHVEQSAPFIRARFEVRLQSPSGERLNVL